MKAFIYRFMFDDGEIMYIGNTTNIMNRLRSHHSYFTITEPIYVDIMEVPYDARYRIESALIRRYRPSCNHFVAKYDNEYKNYKTNFKWFATIHPKENGKFDLKNIEYEDMRNADKEDE